VGLARNRDFVLLQAGQLLSSAGSQATAVAYPLLALALTHSPARTGLVAFARLVPIALLGLPAGAAADRWDRRWVMVAADAVRALAVAALAVALARGHPPFAAVLVVAFVEGAGATFFAPAAAGALRSVVPREELAAATGAQQARRAVVGLAGPPLGGALFGLGRAVPFVGDAVSYACSTVSLLVMRTPFQEPRAADPARLRARLADGVRFLWRRPFLRTTAFLYGLTNIIGPGLFLVVVVAGRRQGLSGGAIGALLAAFAAATLVGSLVSPLLRARLPTRVILLLELWAWPLPAGFLIWPDARVLIAAMLPVALAIPVTDSVVIAQRLAMTPDGLVGRVESVRSTISLLLAPAGPLAAGLLLEGASARVAVAALAALGLLLALWGTASRNLRDAASTRG
jgi:MFS family permease